MVKNRKQTPKSYVYEGQITMNSRMVSLEHYKIVAYTIIRNIRVHS